MRFNSNRLFPPGTLRRLLAKLLMWLGQRPLTLLRQFRFSRVPVCLRYLWQREYALIEDRVAYALEQSGARQFSQTPTEAGNEKALFAGTLIRLAVYVTPETLTDLPQTLAALAQQTYPNWELLLVGAPGLENDRLTALIHPLPAKLSLEIIPLSDVNRLWGRGDYIGIIRAGDKLVPRAIAAMAFPATGALPDLIYCDEEDISRLTPAGPFFKPDWSPQLLLGMNYIGEFFLLKREHLARAGLGRHGFSAEGLYDLLLKSTDHNPKVKHVPSVLYQKSRRSVWRIDHGREILEDTLRRRETPGKVIPLSLPGTYRIHYQVPRQPLVSILLLTALKKPGLLKRCLSSIQNKSTYQNYEIIIVDHSSGGQAAREIPDGLPVTRLAYAGEFNYSRMNNLAASAAKGEFLLLLNDDTEVLVPEWIEALLERAQLPKAGVVGCMLLYPQGTIQHGGMFLVEQGAGARHAFRHLRHPENSYYGLGCVARECSAVTFACALISRTVFQALGGLDEELQVECNDVDFCLQAGQKGYSVHYTPFARLRHYELVTRQKTHISRDIALFTKRWQWLLAAGDPYFNPNLSQDSDIYRPRGAPAMPRVL